MSPETAPPSEPDPVTATAAGLRRHLLIAGLRLRIAWRSVLLWRDRGHSDRANDNCRALTVHLFAGDSSAFTEAMEAVMVQADQATHLAAFRAGVGRAPEPSPERAARLAALPVTRFEKRGEDA